MSSLFSTVAGLDIPVDEARQLLMMAKSMKEPDQHDRTLHGDHVVVLTETPGSPSDRLFTAAAAALGATVTHISPSAAGLFDPNRAQGTTRTLGRLYAAALCDNLGNERTRQLAGRLGIPVFDDVAGDGHPTRLLGDLLTLIDTTDKPLQETTLCVVGSPGDTGSAAWCELGPLVGLQTDVCGHGGPCKPLDADFICAPPAGQPTGPVELWKRERSDGRLRPLGAQRAENQRYVLQALLKARVVQHWGVR